MTIDGIRSLQKDNKYIVASQKALSNFHKTYTPYMMIATKMAFKNNSDDTTCQIIDVKKQQAKS